MSQATADTGNVSFSTWTRLVGEIQTVLDDRYRMESRQIRLGSRTIDAMIADNPAQWAQGMAGIDDRNAAMLFIFPSGTQFTFHMRNVDRDLAVAFFDDDGKICDLGYMKARTGRLEPKRPYTYALEFHLEPDDFAIFRDLADGLTLDE